MKNLHHSLTVSIAPPGGRHEIFLLLNNISVVTKIHGRLEFQAISSEPDNRQEARGQGMT